MTGKRKQQAQNNSLWGFNNRKIRLATSVVVLIGSIGGGIIWLYSTFAQAEDVNKKFDALQTTIIDGQQRMEYRVLEAEKRSLQREQFDYLNIQQKRKLSDIEMQRLKVITEEIGRLDGETKAVKASGQERKK